MARARRGTTVRRVYTYGAKNLAARNIQRAWRSKRARTRRVGESIYNNNCKTVLANDDFVTNKSTGILYSLDLTKCNQGNEANNRERNVINCRGFRVQMCFQNLQGSSTLYLNVAMIAPKASDSVEGNLVVNKNFFRNYGTVTAVDFNAIGLSPFQRHISSINADDYTVIWHKRRLLAPNSYGAATNAMNQRNSMWMLSKYTKLDRQVRYLAPESTAATDGRCFIVYWAGPNGFAADPQSNYQVTQRTVMYFKEPKQ